MAGVKISNLPSIATPAMSDVAPVVQAGVTYKASMTQLGTLFVPISGGTMTGALVLNADPAVALGAATKQYVDAIAAGLEYHGSCVCASTAALTVTYANGSSGVGATLTNAGALAAISLDGVSPTVGQRVLIKDQASAFQNGVYTVTTVGSGAVAWVLTRATDYDSVGSGEIVPGDVIPVDFGGTVNGGSSWMQTATVATIGVDAISFSKFTAAIPITLANGGTSKALTASNGGIVYTDADSMEILAGTATAGQILRSGSSAAPTWSTATYPATAGTTGNVLTSDGTNFTSSLPMGQPYFMAYASGTTATVAATPGIIALATEVVDSGGYFAANRYTPLVAGWYWLFGQYSITTPVDQDYYEIMVYKNGSAASRCRISASGTDTLMVSTAILLQMNGSTDYVELYAQTEANATVASGQTVTYFTGYRIA